MNERLDQSTRRWGAGCHLAGLLAILVCSFAPIPFLGALFPYIVWRLGRDRHSFIDAQGREAVNFQLSMSIYLLVGAILWVFLSFATCLALSSGDIGNTFSWLLILGGIAIGLFAVFMITVIVFAVVKASQGQSYRYPFMLRFLQ
ncbi:MAG TPA: DUF4870 domain-containing protein [Leptolyngbya sp.]|jgi:uncharacterized Tic20 family protein|nr:DUF4870 domain-containing protein [Leptolyngbya sp.]